MLKSFSRGVRPWCAARKSSSKAIKRYFVLCKRTRLDGPTEHIEGLDTGRREIERKCDIPREQLQELLVIDVTIGDQVRALSLPR